MSLYLNPTYYFRSSRIAPSLPMLPVCSTLDNYFVPIFAGSVGKVHEYRGKKMLVYHLKETLMSQSVIPFTLTRFVGSFHTGFDVNKYIDGGLISLQRTEYHMMKHFVYTYVDNQIVVLYALCTTRDHIFNINTRVELDFANSYLLVSNDLFANPIHKTIASKLKSLLNYFKTNDVNIVYTNNVANLCLNQPPVVQRFNTIDERMEFIENIKKELGYIHAIPEPIPPEPPTPDPSISQEFDNLTF